MADRDPFDELGAVPVDEPAEDPFAALGAVEPAEFVPTDQRPSAAAPFPPHPDEAAPPSAEKPFLERVGEGVLGFAQGVGQGALLGAKTPARYASAAGMYLADKALGNDRSFDEELRAATDASESVEKAAPIASTAGQVTGALTTAIGTGGLGTVKLGTQAATKAGGALAARLGASGVMTAQQANAVRLGSAVAGLMTAGAAAGAQQTVVRKVDEAIATGDYKGLAETIVPAILEDAAKGAAIDLGLGALGTTVSHGIKKLVEAGAGDWVSGRAFKAILGITKSKGVKLADKRIPGGKEELGRSMMDEGVVTADASFDEIADRLGQKREEVGRLLGEARKELDDVAGGVDTAPDGRALWDHIEGRVLGHLRADPVKKGIGRSLETKLADVKAYLLGDDTAKVASDPWRQRAIAAAAEAPTVAGNPRTAKVLSPNDDPFTMGRPKPAKVDQLVPTEAARRLNVDDPFRMGAAPAAVEATGQLVPGAARSTLNVDDAFRMGSPEPPRRLSWEDITQLRQSMDDVLKWESLSKDVGLEAYRDVRRAVNEFWMESAEKAAEQAGNPELVKRIKMLTSRYAKLSLADDLAKEGQAARAANRFFSASDHGIGGAASVLVAITSGGSAIPALAAGAAGAAANKVARERGNQIIAGTMYGLSKRLIRTQERIQKAASLPRLLQNAAAVNSAAAGSTAASTPMMTPMLAEQREKRVSKDLRRAEALLDPESEENRELTGSLQALELEVGTDVAAAVRDKALERAKFIVDKAPPTPPPSVFDGEPKRELGDDDINSLHRYIEAVDDPEAALQRLGDGEATAEDLDTLGSLYPSMLKDFRTAAANTLSQMKNPPPYEDRLALADTLGIPLTADTDPMSVAYWQGVAVEGAAAAQERNAQNQAPVRGTKSYEQPADKVLSTADRIA